MNRRLWIALTLTIGLAWPLTRVAAAGGVQGTGSGSSLIVYLPAVWRGCHGCRTLPTLIQPANGSQLDTLIPLYKWDRGDNPSMEGIRVEIARDAAFSRQVPSLWSSKDGLDQFRFPSNLEPATTYYWRARLDCGGERGPWTEVWSFTTGSGGTVLPAPVLLEPANGAVLESRRVTMRWMPVPSAVEYARYGRKAGETYTGFAWQDGTEWTSSYAYGTTYEWWVAARNDYAIGTPAAIWQFTTPAAPSSVREEEGSSP